MGVPLKLVDNLSDHYDWIGGFSFGRPGTEGFGRYYTRQESEEPVGLIFICPGCRAISSIAFTNLDNRPMWTWNRDRVKPTCTPSILHTAPAGCGWHGYLTDGEFREC